MTHALCPRCRLRFTPAAAASLEACPICGDAPRAVASPQDAVGSRLFTHASYVDALPAAISAALASSAPREGPS